MAQKSWNLGNYINSQKVKKYVFSTLFSVTVNNFIRELNTTWLQRL